MRADTRQTGNWYKSCIGGSPTLRHNYRSRNTTERVRLPHLQCVTAATPILVTVDYQWKSNTLAWLKTKTSSVCPNCHTHLWPWTLWHNYQSWNTLELDTTTPMMVTTATPTLVTNIRHNQCNVAKHNRVGDWHTSNVSQLPHPLFRPTLWQNYWAEIYTTLMCQSCHTHSRDHGSSNCCTNNCCQTGEYIIYICSDNI